MSWFSRLHGAPPKGDMEADPKINGEQARGSVRAEPGSDRRGAGCPVRARSGGGLEGDLVAEGLQLADVVALGAFRTDAGVVEAGAEVVEVDLWVGQQVPGDDQDGPADRDDRFLGAAAAGDPPVAFTQEGIGLAGGDGGLAEHASEVGVAVPGRSAALGVCRRTP